MEGRGNTTIVLDFDNTMIDSNSDEIVPCKVQGGIHADSFKKKLSTLTWGDSWTEFMNDIFADLANEGVSLEDLSSTLRDITIDPQLI